MLGGDGSWDFGSVHCWVGPLSIADREVGIFFPYFGSSPTFVVDGREIVSRASEDWEKRRNTVCNAVSQRGCSGGTARDRGAVWMEKAEVCYSFCNEELLGTTTVSGCRKIFGRRVKCKRCL